VQGNLGDPRSIDVDDELVGASCREHGVAKLEDECPIARNAGPESLSELELSFDLRCDILGILILDADPDESLRSNAAPRVPPHARGATEDDLIPG